MFFAKIIVATTYMDITSIVQRRSTLAFLPRQYCESKRVMHGGRQICTVYFVPLGVVSCRGREGRTSKVG